MKWFSRLLSVTSISIEGARITIRKGKIDPSLTRELRSLFSGLDLSGAEIWIDGSGKISFSHEIPAQYHQRLRNLLIGVDPSS